MPPALSDRIRNGGPSSAWKRFDHGALLAHSRAAVQHQAGAAEQGPGVLGQRVDDLPLLGEDQHALLAGGQLLAELGQPQELAAGGGVVLTVTRKLAGMVAHLLEPQ